MGKKIFAIALISLSVNLFSSCSKSDDDDNTSKYSYQKSGKKLVSSTSSLGKTYTFSYDNYGRVANVVCRKGNNDGWERNTTFNDSSFDYEKIQSDDSSIVKGSATFNEMGYISTMSQKDENDKVNEMKMTYNSKGQITSIEHTFKHGDDQETVNYVWIWENNDISKYETHLIDYFGNPMVMADEYIYTNDVVTTPIENKGLMTLFQGYYDVEEEVNRLMLGLACEHLPVEIKNENEISKFEWTLDADGYPVKVKITDKVSFVEKVYETTYDFTWK